jgi:mannose-6-phosphate isomerase-like protein (cupin superfamily)
MEGATKPKAQLFKYRAPSGETKPRHIVWLCRTDRMVGNVQVIKKGGENTLHSHKHLDGFWMVLKGRARFYGEGDEVIAELGPHDGIMVPRGFKYWFEAVEGETLELLQVEAFDVPLKTREELFGDRVEYTEKKEKFDAVSESTGTLEKA